MRPSTLDTSLIRDASGDFIGIQFGYGCCAEHERGIKELESSFGIPTDEQIFGVERRAITKFEKDDLRYIKLSFHKMKTDILSFVPVSDYIPKEKTDKVIRKHLRDYLPWTILNPEYRRKEDERIACSWDNKSFAVAVSLDDHKKFLKRVHTAFLSNDILIGLSDSINPFGKSSLLIMIASQVDEELKNKMYDDDKKFYEEKMK